jgi:hypothetical protein
MILDNGYVAAFDAVFPVFSASSVIFYAYLSVNQRGKARGNCRRFTELRRPAWGVGRNGVRPEGGRTGDAPVPEQYMETGPPLFSGIFSFALAYPLYMAYAIRTSDTCTAILNPETGRVCHA